MGLRSQTGVQGTASRCTSLLSRLEYAVWQIVETLKKYSLVLVMFAFCSGSWSYTRITASSGGTPKWPSMPISFWINEKGYTQIGNGSEFPAVLSAFQTWENVPTADIRFNYLGT